MGAGRRERKRRVVHERIYQTARRLFLEQGLDPTTVEQIAEAADVAQATFFNHFSSKRAVLREMASEGFGRMRVLLETLRKRPASTQERLAGFASEAAEIIERTPDLIRDGLLEVLRPIARPGPAGPQGVSVHGDFAAIFRDGQMQGDVCGHQDVWFLAGIALNVFHGTIVLWSRDPGEPLEPRLLQAAAFLGSAILPR